MNGTAIHIEGLVYGPYPSQHDLDALASMPKEGFYAQLGLKVPVRPTIWLDVDGVLVDFVGGVLDVWFQETGIIVDREDLTQWSIFDSGHLDKDICSRRIEQQGFCKSLRPFPDAKEAVKTLQSVADVYACTSPWTESHCWVDERTAYLEEVFGIDYHHQIHTHAKQLVWADVIIDDRPANVRRWSEKWLPLFPQSKALLWDTTHNRGKSTSGLCRVRSWKEVLGLVTGTMFGNNEMN